MTNSSPPPKQDKHEIDFPFSEFLRTLGKFGINPNYDDYKRISTVLNTNNNWNLNNLEKILSCIFIHDEKLKKAFKNHFFEFFKTNSDHLYDGTFIDISKIRDDLNLLKSAPEKHTKEHEERDIEQKTKIKNRKTPKNYTEFHIENYKKGIFLLLPPIIITLAILFFIFINNYSLSKIFTDNILAEPNQIAFRLGESDFKTVNIYTNNEKKFSIKDIIITNSSKSKIAISSQNCFGKTNNLINKCQITLSFSRIDEKIATQVVNSLEVYHNQSSTPLKIPISVIRPNVSNETQQNTSFILDGILTEEAIFASETSSILGSGLALTLLILNFAYSIWLFSKRTPSRERANRRGLSNLDQATVFDPALVGGDRPRLLSDWLLDELAHRVSYSLSAENSTDIDTAESIVKTVEAGGIPSLRYHAPKRLKNVIVLKPQRVEPEFWNTVPDELVQGLQMRGIPIRQCLFDNLVREWVTYDKEPILLDDLEPSETILLIFTDGKHSNLKGRREELHALNRFPTVAWFELREKRFWDAWTLLPMERGLNVYPADEEGMREAFRNLGSHQNSQPDHASQFPHALLRPKPIDQSLASYLEQVLGDTLAWAQSCSMMVPPVSFGLADRLRIHFYPHIPRSSLGRLAGIPNTVVANGCFAFSREALAALRMGFHVRNTSNKRSEIVEFIIREIEASEPLEYGSLRHESWKWRLERVRLEEYGTEGLDSLFHLARGPHGDAITADLAWVEQCEEKTNTSSIPGKIPIFSLSEHRQKRKLKKIQTGDVATPQDWAYFLFQVIRDILKFSLSKARIKFHYFLSILTALVVGITIALLNAPFVDFLLFSFGLFWVSINWILYKQAPEKTLKPLPGDITIDPIDAEGRIDHRSWTGLHEANENNPYIY